MKARRILIYGVTGSGKSTLAKAIAERTGLPCIVVDDLTWDPGWQPVPPEVQRERFSEICSQESWILDSAYSFWLDIPLDRAQLIIALDYPRWLSFGRLLRRTVLRAIDKSPVCNGNHESWRIMFSRDSILLWHFKTFRARKERIDSWISEGRSVLRFRWPIEAETWLRSLEI